MRWEGSHEDRETEIVVLPQNLENTEQVQGELRRWSLYTVKVNGSGGRGAFSVHGLSNCEDADAFY